MTNFFDWRHYHYCVDYFLDFYRNNRSKRPNIPWSGEEAEAQKVAYRLVQFVSPRAGQHTASRRRRSAKAGGERPFSALSPRSSGGISHTRYELLRAIDPSSSPSSATALAANDTESPPSSTFPRTRFQGWRRLHGE
jgi:hypothetical protein